VNNKSLFIIHKSFSNFGGKIWKETPKRFFWFETTIFIDF